jgi:hypothetical protein
MIRTQVSLTGTSLNASNAPINVITSQSASPAFLRKGNGLLGLAYASLSSWFADEPSSLFDSWVQTGKINNQIGFKGCPYTLMTNAFVDFGNSAGFSACGSTGPVVTAKSPEKKFHSLNIANMYVGSSKISLPSSFQAATPTTGIFSKWSIIDSCSSLIYVPSAMTTVLVQQIIASGGLPSTDLTASDKYNFASGNIQLYTDSSLFNWKLLPTVTFGTSSLI